MPVFQSVFENFKVIADLDQLTDHGTLPSRNSTAAICGYGAKRAPKLNSGPYTELARSLPSLRSKNQRYLDFHHKNNQGVLNAYNTGIDGLLRAIEPQTMQDEWVPQLENKTSRKRHRACSILERAFEVKSAAATSIEDRMALAPLWGATLKQLPKLDKEQRESLIDKFTAAFSANEPDVVKEFANEGCFTALTEALSYLSSDETATEGKICELLNAVLASSSPLSKEQRRDIDTNLIEVPPRAYRLIRENMTRNEVQNAFETFSETLAARLQSLKN